MGISLLKWVYPYFKMDNSNKLVATTGFGEKIDFETQLDWFENSMKYYFN